MERRYQRRLLSDGASILTIAADGRRPLRAVHETRILPQLADRTRARSAESSNYSAHDWGPPLRQIGAVCDILGMTPTNTRLVAAQLATGSVCHRPSGEITMHPEMAARHFSERPSLLCSRPHLSAFDDTHLAFEGSRFVLKVPPHGWKSTRLVAVTDALAEWIARAKGPTKRRVRLERLAGLRTAISFEAFVTRFIATGRVRRDDCALLVVDL